MEQKRIAGEHQQKGKTPLLFAMAQDFDVEEHDDRHARFADRINGCIRAQTTEAYVHTKKINIPLTTTYIDTISW